jgi:hypothetical protein
MRVGTELATGEISHVPMGLAHIEARTGHAAAMELENG